MKREINAKFDGLRETAAITNVVARRGCAQAEPIFQSHEPG